MDLYSSLSLPMNRFVKERVGQRRRRMQESRKCTKIEKEPTDSFLVRLGGHANKFLFSKMALCTAWHVKQQYKRGFVKGKRGLYSSKTKGILIESNAMLLTYFQCTMLGKLMIIK